MSNSKEFNDDLFDAGHLSLSIARDFLNFMSADLARGDSILASMDGMSRAGLIDGVLCLLDRGMDDLAVVDLRGEL
jgi:hypothetical protein